MIVELSIKNWAKHNPRGDVKSSTWFRMSNDFFSDPEFYGVSNETRIIWVYLLCVASKKNNFAVKINIQMIVDTLRYPRKTIENSLSELEKMDCIEKTVKNDKSTRSDSIVHEMLPSATNERTDERTDDLVHPLTRNVVAGFFTDDEPQELEEIQADELSIKILTALNSICFSNFRPVKANLKFINARISEGYAYEDFVAAIKHRNDLWRNDSKMKEFLRPKTLFNSENFDGYVQAAKNANKPKLDPLDEFFAPYVAQFNQEAL